ncbi:hypothetical protein HDU89_004750 [Geranomyces variabilis]|nr:hypothetical protein HDU89_004750 [Geranomyces variabilis]
MSAPFAQNFVSQQVAKTLLQAGFDHSQSSASAVLTDIFCHHLASCAARAASAAELQGRRVANMEDVARVLEEVGTDPAALLEFCKTWMTPARPRVSDSNSSAGRAGAGHQHHHHHQHRPPGSADDLEWEPAAFPINIDEIQSHSIAIEKGMALPGSALPAGSESAAPNVTPAMPTPNVPSLLDANIASRKPEISLSASSSTRATVASSPTKAVSFSVHLTDVHDIYHGQPHPKRRKPSQYGRLVPYEKSHAAQTAGEEDEWHMVATSISRQQSSAASTPARAPSPLPTDPPQIPSLQQRESSVSLQKALAAVKVQPGRAAATATDNHNSRALSKALLPVMQQRQRLMQGNPDSLCHTDRGILDGLLGIALPFLPGLLEGQRPVRPSVIVEAAKRKKMEADAKLNARAIAVANSGGTASVAGGGDQPKIKLKFSSRPQPSQSSQQLPQQQPQRQQQPPQRQYQPAPVPHPLPTSRLSQQQLPGNPSSAPTSTTVTQHAHAVWSPDEPINCVCHNPHFDDGLFMIACDRCGVWFHGRCVGVPSEHDQAPGRDWYCEAYKKFGSTVLTLALPHCAYLPPPAAVCASSKYFIMDRFGLDSVVRVACEIIPKARRFTSMSDLELTCLWRDIVGYLEAGLSQRGHRQQTLLLPGFGTFYTRKAAKSAETAYAAHFVPSRGWGKVPGYSLKAVPSSLDGAMPSDPFNFSAVACQSGCSRETVELGLKDLTHAVLRVVKRGAVVVLPFAGIGKLKFGNGRIAFCFSAEFLAKLSAADPLHAAKSSDERAQKSDSNEHHHATSNSGSINKSFTPDAHLSIEPAAPDKHPLPPPKPTEPKPADSSNSSTTKPATEATTDNQEQGETPTAGAATPSGNEQKTPIGAAATDTTPPPSQPSSRPSSAAVVAATPAAAIAAGSSAPPASASPDIFPLNPARRLVYIAKPDRNSLEFTISSVGTHSHTHSGDRQWNDLQCPICRNAKVPAMEQLRSRRSQKDKEQDRLLLQLSLDLDQEYLLKAKTKERAKMAIAMNDAEYNRAKACENEILRRKPAIAPVGNMFDERDSGPDPVTAGQELARGLQEQIAARQIRKAQERLQTKYENGIMNQRLTEDLKKAELETHIEKLRKRTQQQQMLAEQIRLQKHAQATAAAALDPTGVASSTGTAGNHQQQQQPNPFTRSENLMLLYQKQKAKQLYAEQLMIVRQKREHQDRLAEIEKAAAMRTLEVSAQELSYDLRNAARQKCETRRGLEHYWGQQLALKKRLREGQPATATC